MRGCPRVPELEQEEAIVKSSTEVTVEFQLWIELREVLLPV